MIVLLKKLNSVNMVKVVIISITRKNIKEKNVPSLQEQLVLQNFFVFRPEIFFKKKQIEYFNNFGRTTTVMTETRTKSIFHKVVIEREYFNGKEMMTRQCKEKMIVIFE